MQRYRFICTARLLEIKRLNERDNTNHNNNSITSQQIEWNLSRAIIGPRPCLSITSEEVIARLPIDPF